jgi:hypothetical protein
MKKTFQLLSVVFLIVFFASACKKDDDNDKDSAQERHEMLYDKWWYNVGNQGKGDHFFNSDGTVLITIPPIQGTWLWTSNDSLQVTFPGSAPSIFHFTNIQENAMSYWPTYEPAGNIYNFSTIDPTP